jgi:membrane carboxypeptidase/penicillin-binding protein
VTWFLGTPGLVAGVWVGYDDQKSISHKRQARAALPIWLEFMKGARKLLRGFFNA